MMHISGGIATIKSLIDKGDPSIRLNVEYEAPTAYTVAASIASKKDTENPPAELFNQFISPRTVNPPGKSLVYMRDCVVLPNAAIITSGGAIILESCFPYADRKRILRMFHPWIFEEKGEIYAKAELLEKVDDPVVYLREHGEMGFFHWMHSVFPRIECIFQQGVPGDFALLVQSRARFQSQALNLFDLRSRKTIPPSLERPQFFKELIFPSALVDSGDFWLRPPSVKRFYDNIPIASQASPKRLYVTRQDASMRRLTNENQVLSLLNDLRFEAVELAKLNFSEQLSLFRNAELVVGVHGAGLAHVVSMKVASGVLEILHPRRFWATYRAMSARANLHYGFVVGDDPGPEVSGDSFDFNIDLEKLSDVLQLLIKCKRS